MIPTEAVGIESRWNINVQFHAPQGRAVYMEIYRMTLHALLLYLVCLPCQICIPKCPQQSSGRLEGSKGVQKYLIARGRKTHPATTPKIGDRKPCNSLWTEYFCTSHTNSRLVYTVALYCPWMPHHLAASLFAIVQLCPSHQHNRHRSLLRVSSSGRAPLPPTHPLFHPFDVAFALPKQFPFLFFFFCITKWLQPTNPSSK